MLGTQQDAGRLSQTCRDDGKVCGEDQPLHFFGLPTELRHRVYELVLGKDLALHHQDPDVRERFYEELVNVALFEVNKFMRDEAIGWFFANNEFVLDYDEYGMSGVMPFFILKNGHHQPFWPLENLKTLRIEIVLYRPSQRQDVEKTLKEICNVLANCTRILEIKIVCFSFHHFYEPLLDAVMDEILERFCSLRGIGNVIFLSQSEMAKLPRHSFRRIIGTQKQKERVAQLMMARA